MLKKIKVFAKISKQAFILLKRTEPMILSSSTAFFTTFALSPILILLLTFFGLYFKSDRISRQVFGKLASKLGTETAVAIENIVNNFRNFETTWWMTVIGSVFFIFIATTLLMVVKQNIHKLWRIRKTRRHVRYQLRERLILAGLIVLTGLIFLVSLAIDSSLAISLDYVQIVIPKIGIIVIKILNLLFSVVIITIWFTMIFKLLPDARVNWDVAFNGAFITSLLFSIGQYALGKFLLNPRIATIFGASASFALLLLFIFYASFILYYGAAFTHEYGEYANKHICAGKYSHEYEERLISLD